MTRCPRVLPLFPCITAILFISSCTPRYARVEYCDPDIQALLIDETAMPSTWIQADGEPTKNDQFSHGAVNHCMVTFYASNDIEEFGGAGEQIFQYKTEQEAAADYRRMEDLFFWEEAEPFVAPSLDLANADNYYVACAIPRDTPMCKLLAQYGVYVIEFNIHMASGFITDNGLRLVFTTNDDLVQVLQAIDERMALSDSTR